jgi:hypothetical protein
MGSDVRPEAWARHLTKGGRSLHSLHRCDDGIASPHQRVGWHMRVVCSSDLLDVACESVLVRDGSTGTMCRQGLACIMPPTVVGPGDCALRSGVLSLFCDGNPAGYIPYMKIEIF